MDFTVLGDIVDIETFAVDRGIHERGRLLKRYGKDRWRKHWYEATGIGRKELKIKRYLD